MAGKVENGFQPWTDSLKERNRKEQSMTTVAINQIFRVGVGFAAWCALRQVLMIWSMNV